VRLARYEILELLDCRLQLVLMTEEEEPVAAHDRRNVTDAPGWLRVLARQHACDDALLGPDPRSNDARDVLDPADPAIRALTGVILVAPDLLPRRAIRELRADQAITALAAQTPAHLEAHRRLLPRIEPAEVSSADDVHVAIAAQFRRQFILQ